MEEIHVKTNIFYFKIVIAICVIIVFSYDSYAQCQERLESIENEMKENRKIDHFQGIYYNKHKLLSFEVGSYEDAFEDGGNGSRGETRGCTYDYINKIFLSLGDIIDSTKENEFINVAVSVFADTIEKHSDHPEKNIFGDYWTSDYYWNSYGGKKNAGYGDVKWCLNSKELPSMFRVRKESIIIYFQVSTSGHSSGTISIEILIDKHKNLFNRNFLQLLN